MSKFFESAAFASGALGVLFISWFIGLHYGLFFIIKWLDAPFHFFGGFCVYILWYSFVKGSRIEISGLNSRIFFFLAGMGFVFMIGVFWEFFELGLDRYVTHAGLTYLPGVFEDTLSDLFFDFFGGVTAYLLYNKFYG